MTATTWLVTGGVGYVGSHVVRALLDRGRDVVVYDDFSSGLDRRVPGGVRVVRGDVSEMQSLSEALRANSIDGVAHLAVKKAAGELVGTLLYYYRENVMGVLAVLEAMKDANVLRLVYSSSAVVYGTPEANPVSEDAVLRAESPYGWLVTAEWHGGGRGRRCATSMSQVPAMTTLATTASTT
jgi:UDP-glucose 4-epimerase